MTTICQPPVERQTTNGTARTSIAHGGITEVHITLTPLDGEGIAAMLARGVDMLSEVGAKPITVLVLAPTPMTERGIDLPCPFTWVDGRSAPDGTIAGIQMIGIAGADVTTIRLWDQPVASVFETEDARWAYIGGLCPSDPGAQRTCQTRDALERLEAVLHAADMGWPNVARTWLFLNRILEWYDDFNPVRTKLFEERGVLGAVIPASTGIAGANPAGAALALQALAIEPRSGTIVQPAASPLQCPAPKYGSSFSRGMEISTPGVRRIYVSGTASIAPGGESAYDGDIEAQVDLTMRVVAAILDTRGLTLNDTSRAIAYYKRPQDAGTLERWCSSAGVAPLPALSVAADVCRDALLFELELDAVVAC